LRNQWSGEGRENPGRHAGSRGRREVAPRGDGPGLRDTACDWRNWLRDLSASGDLGEPSAPMGFVLRNCGWGGRLEDLFCNESVMVLDAHPGALQRSSVLYCIGEAGTSDDLNPCGFGQVVLR
jgi:hypothetical protein